MEIILIWLEIFEILLNFSWKKKKGLKITLLGFLRGHLITNNTTMRERSHEMGQGHSMSNLSRDWNNIFS